MTRSGGYYDEMRNDHTDDAGLEAMITGSPDPDHPLGRMLTDLKDSATGWPTSDQAAEHVAAAVHQARLNVPAPVAPKAAVPTRHRIPRRRTVFSFLTTSLIGKILVGSMALAATTGSLAATGNLPDTAQTAVANTVGVIGIQIPNPAEIDEAVETDEAPEVDEAVETDEAPEVDEAVETDEAPEVDEAVETDEAPEVAEAPEADEAAETDEAPEATG